MKAIAVNLSDEELVNACRGGDETAWETIVYKYQNMLFAIPKRAGLSQDLAADVLQDVFKTLFEKLDAIEQPQYLRAWLTTTARHKTIHLIQRETRGKTASLFDDENNLRYEVQDETPPPDENLIRLEKEIQVEAAIGKIDERCRRLLWLLYFETETISYDRIADMLNIPVGSIGPTRARCLQKLAKFLPE
ncbi:MAG TPA: sigma-70 family RNA polymerase sigma factor [Pyrinomonadaceae bacterium]|nr:sigma-70 family RNA polymerase sigma factor [Pyrinomonadaceae bacterium]